MSRKLPLSYVGGLGPIPPIDSLDSPGLGLRQAYSVSIAQGNAKARRSAPAAGGPVERRAENDSELRVPACNLETAHVLVWALGRNGHCGDALGYSKRALGLGTWDASSFHRG